MANITKINNRYKVRISESPIFWTINSINHPSQKLWENTYLPTFIDIDCYVNWVDVFTVTSVLDKSTYTMLELTDTVTNEVMYFLNSKINKKLSSGYEMEFKVDIYLTFGLKFYAWMVDNKLPINVKRFLNNDLLKEWYKQFKFIQQDELLNFTTGTQKITMNPVQNNKNMSYVFNIYNSDDWLKDGTQTLTGTGSASINWVDTSIKPITNWNQMLFYVFEQNDGNYFCIAKYGNYIQDGITNSSEPTMEINTNDGNYNVLLGNSVDSITSNDYWINRFVGIFLCPPWFLIPNWFILTGSKNYLGFSITRSGFIALYSLNNSISWDFGDSNFKIMNNSIFDESTQNYIIDNDYNFNCNILYYNPTDDELNDNNKYFVNAYFLSQVRKSNSVIQLPPIDGYWNMFENAILTFDGTNFNVVNNFQNVKSFIETYPGTINVSIDSYKEWLSQAQPIMNAQLQTTKASLDIQQNQNIFNGVFSSIGSFFGMMGSIGDGNAMGGISNLLNIGSTIGNSVFNSQKMNQDYQNLQTQQDAEMSSKKIGSGASNISSSFTLDDSYVKLLLTNQNNNNSIIYGKSYVVDFISNINDLKFIHNLIWKNGLKANMYITADVAFQDSTMDKIGNQFIYLSFDFDDNYVRMFSPNLPVEYVDALKIVCNNTLRIWNNTFDLSKMPNYYIDFHNQARIAFQELNLINITYSFNNSDQYGVYINPDTLTLNDNQLKATDYVNNANIDIIKQLFFDAVYPNDVNRDDFTFNVLTTNYVATLDSNLQNDINNYFKNESYDPNDSNGYIYYLVYVESNKYFSNQNYNNLKYLNTYNNTNYYIIQYNAPFKNVNLSELDYIQVSNTTFKWLKIISGNQYYNDLNNQFNITIDNNPQSITIQSNNYLGIINDIDPNNSTTQILNIEHNILTAIQSAYSQVSNISNLSVIDNNDNSYTINFTLEVSS